MGALRRRAGVVVTVLAGLAGTAATALGATTWVVNAGSSVQAAIDGASAGDTIQIRGVHREAITVTKTLFFTVGAAGGTLDGSSLGTTIATFSNGVTGCTFTGVTFRFGESNGVYMPDNDSTSFTACTFKGMANAAIQVDFSDAVTIAFCNFRGNDTDIEGGADTNLTLTSNKHRKSTGNAVNVWDSDMTMAGCTFDMARSTAIQLEGNDTYSSVGTSRVYRSEGGLNCSDVDGLGIGDLDGQWIRGSFFYDYPGTGSCIGYNYYYNPYYGYYQGNCNNSLQNGGAAVADCAVTHVGNYGFRLYGDYASVDTSKVITGGGWAFRMDSYQGLIEDSSATNASQGIYLGGSNGSNDSMTVRRNTLTGVLREGILGRNIDSPDIADNLLSGVAGGYGGAAILFMRSPYASVTGNTVGDVDGGIGILIDGCDYGYVGRNTVKNTAAEGILGRSYQYRYRTNCTYYGYWGCYSYAYGYSTEGETIQISYNTVSSCGNSQSPAISVRYLNYGSVDNNVVASSGGVGIQLDHCDGTSVYRNTVTFAERDGIWNRYNWYYYGAANTIDSNTVKWSGAEGIQISACHFYSYGEVVSSNLVTASALQNLANEGYIDTASSTGNINGVGVSIDPASWYAIVPVERRLYGGATFCGGGE